MVRVLRVDLLMAWSAVGLRGAVGDRGEACEADDGVYSPVAGNVYLQRKTVRERAVVGAEGEEQLVPKGTPPVQWAPKFPRQPPKQTQDLALLARDKAFQIKMNSTTMRTVTAAEKSAFLDMHNLYRCMHGVAAVKWNDDVAASAEQYIAPMTDMVHSQSYNIPPPAGPAGENLAWSSAGLGAADAVAMWYDEVNNCKKGPTHFTDGCADDSNGVTGHFTALIWEGVKEIGCAFSDSTAPTVVICRYKAGDSLSLDTPNMNHPDNYPNHVHPQMKEEGECEGVEVPAAASEIFVKHENTAMTGSVISVLQTSDGFHGTESECSHKCIEHNCQGFERTSSGSDIGHCSFYLSPVTLVASSPGVDSYVRQEQLQEPTAPMPEKPATTPPPASVDMVPHETEEEVEETDDNACQGNADTFNSGWGKCGTYSKGKPNHGYCNQDRDKITNMLAAKVCSECGECGAAEPEPAAEAAPLSDGGIDWVNPDTCKYADPAWHCTGYNCVPKDQYMYYSAAGGAWCLTNASPLCQGEDYSWCSGSCACPGMCPHACGRCPPK
jgi:pathogenesis-related protein 1